MNGNFVSPNPHTSQTAAPYRQVGVELVGTISQINALLGKAAELGIDIVKQTGFRPVGGHVRKPKP